MYQVLLTDEFDQWLNGLVTTLPNEDWPVV